MMELKFDSKQVQGYLRKLGDTRWGDTPFARQELARFLARVINSANNKYPRTPHRHGDLRGSGKFEMDNSGRDGLTAKVGFDMIYAHRIHEGKPEWNWSEAGTGPKYLEDKMPEVNQFWEDACANILKGAMSDAG